MANRYPQKNKFGAHQRIFLRPFLTDKENLIVGEIVLEVDEDPLRPNFSYLRRSNGSSVASEAGVNLENMRCVQVQRTYSEDKSMASYTYTFEGYMSDNIDDIEFEFDITMSQEPIETHPDFENLNSQFGPWDPINRAWPRNIPADTSKAGLSAANDPTQRATNPMYGVTSYLVPGAVYRVSYAAKDVPSGVLTGVGTIVQPPTVHGFNAISQYLSSKSGHRNWLKLNPRVRKRGAAVHVVEEYMLSGPRGWDPNLYNAKALSES